MGDGFFSLLEYHMVIQIQTIPLRAVRIVPNRSLRWLMVSLAISSVFSVGTLILLAEWA